MEATIKEIMETVFEQDLSGFENSQISPKTIENWDSLAHLSLVTALEQEFSVEIDIDSITEMLGGFETVCGIIGRLIS